MTNWFILLPLTGALFGWLCNMILVNLYFSSSRNPVFWKKKKAEIAAVLVNHLSADLSLSFVEKKISDPANFQKILPVAEEHIDHFLRVKLKEAMPMIGMLIGDRTINQLKEIFIKELEELFPSVMQSYAQQLQQDFDVKQFIANKIEAIPEQVLADHIKKQVSKPLILWGAIAGFVIGLLQSVLLYIAS